ncbi:dihydrodipicolinate synthase family protein [Pantoea sp. FN060301]|uniref:dihydrodipicolinate synthase family protein n=1 Tax=Pantoea sp. FN060301 TaxID=3420380 RepID=UPI003D16AEDD
MFNGLCAFPLTPMDESGTDDRAYLQLLGRLVDANVDSICVLGSTGNYAYLPPEERARLIKLATETAGPIPVMTSIGALRTRDVLNAAEDAQKAGAQALLLAPLSYQKLTEEEVYSLYQTVAQSVSVPLCVYENPGTTHFHFSDELLIRIAQLPAVGSVKLSGGYPDKESYLERIRKLRSAFPERVSLGISGDAFAAPALNTGCDTWYSVIAGLFPQAAMTITRQALNRESGEVNRQLEPVWELFRQYGSLRVIAAAAAILGLTQKNNLPLPLTLPGEEAMQRISDILRHLNLA